MDFDLSQLDSVRNNSQKLTSSSKFHPKFAAKPRAKPQESSKEINETHAGSETVKDARQRHSVVGQPGPPNNKTQTSNRAAQVTARNSDGDVQPRNQTELQKYEHAAVGPVSTVPITVGRSRARKQKPTASSTGVQAGGGHITSNPKRPELQRKYSNSKAVSDPQNKILDRPQCTSDIEKERGRPGGSANTTQEEKDSGRDSPKKRSKTAGLVTTAISTRPAPGRKIVDKELDHVNWAIKDIVRWGNARERRMEKEKAKRKEADAEDAEKNSQGQRRNSIQAVATTEKQFSTNLAKRREDEGQMALAPQVTVVEGKIVVNRHSLTVQAQEKQEYTRVVTEDANKLNSMTYMSRISNERWSAEDTELFYKAVSQFGTDFTLITHLFPGRQRRHLKNKFTRESKINPMRMDQALQASAQATIQSYEEMIAMLRESGTDVGNKGSGQEGEMLQLEDAKTVAIAQQPARSGPSNRGRRKKVTRGES